jgi:hypothetical protein
MVTFVLRVVAGRYGLRGSATHVASGETRAFAGQADLWTFLEERAAMGGIGEFSAEWTHDSDEFGPVSGFRARAEQPPPAPGAP